MGKPSDLVQGTLDLLILKTLLPDAMHGWAIAKRIQQMSGDVLQVQQGSLYPALHRLEQQGWIKAKMGGERNRPPGEVLFADRRGALPTGKGNSELEPAFRGHQPDRGEA